MKVGKGKLQNLYEHQTVISKGISGFRSFRLGEGDNVDEANLQSGWREARKVNKGNPDADALWEQIEHSGWKNKKLPPADALMLWPVVRMDHVFDYLHLALKEATRAIMDATT